MAKSTWMLIGVGISIFTAYVLYKNDSQDLNSHVWPAGGFFGSDIERGKVKRESPPTHSNNVDHQQSVQINASKVNQTNSTVANADSTLKGDKDKTAKESQKKENVVLENKQQGDGDKSLHSGVKRHSKDKTNTEKEKVIPNAENVVKETGHDQKLPDDKIQETKEEADVNIQIQNGNLDKMENLLRDFVTGDLSFLKENRDDESYANTDKNDANSENYETSKTTETGNFENSDYDNHDSVDSQEADNYANQYSDYDGQAQTDGEYDDRYYQDGGYDDGSYDENSYQDGHYDAAAYDDDDYSDQAQQDVDYSDHLYHQSDDQAKFNPGYWSDDGEWVDVDDNGFDIDPSSDYEDAGGYEEEQELDGKAEQNHVKTKKLSQQDDHNSE